MSSKRTFLLDKENFSAVTVELHDALSKTNATEKEVLRADLLVEETFLRMSNLGDAQDCKIKILRRFGDVSVVLESTGAESNPLIEVTDFDEEDEDYFRTMILKANRAKMNFVRKNGKNIVTIHIHDTSNKQIYYTLIGMFGGVIVGLVMKEFFSPETVAAFDSTIVKNFRTMFLHALNMMIAPVIFFSVISGVTSITNAADVGRIGGKLISFYTVTTIIASILSVAFGYFVFLGDVPQLGTATGVGESQNFSLLQMLVEIIPEQLVAPVIERDMLQIIFVAVVFGIGINKLGDKVQILHDFIDAMNSLFLRLIVMIVSFIPLIAFLSMASLIFNIGLDSVLMLGKLVLGQLGGSLLMISVYALMLLFIGKISPVPFLKKIVGFIPIPLSTSSSNATMPFSMKFCTEKLGISPKLSSFSIPIGATVNMDGSCFYLSIASIMLAKMYGVELTTDVLFTIFVTVIALSIGAPGVPGGAFVCLASILSAIGLPTEATAVILGIDPICSMIRSTLNCTGDVAATAALARVENLMDADVYKKI